MNQAAVNLLVQDRYNLHGSPSQAVVNAMINYMEGLADQHPDDSDVSLTATDLAAVAATDRITSAGGDMVAEGFEVGQWVNVSGFTGNAANNGTFKVLAVATGYIGLDAALVDDGAGESVTITCEVPRRHLTNDIFFANENIRASENPT